jgi:hypothetical protein
MSDRDKQNVRVIDVGGSIMTTMFHMAQTIPGYYARIDKYDPLRVRMFADSYFCLICEHKNDLKIQSWLIFVICKQMKVVNTFDFNIVYSFDQALSFEDYSKLIQVFNDIL